MNARDPSAPVPSGRSRVTVASGEPTLLSMVSIDRSLEEQLRDLRFAIDEASIVAATDVGGRIIRVNKRFCDISGYSEAELLGQDHRLVNSGVHPKSLFVELWRTIGGGRVWRGELCNRRKDGALYWVDTTIIPLLDANGRPYRYMSIRTDVTARVEAERRLREQMALARLGEMASVVAHEVKNPLAGIGGAVQIVRKRLPEGSAERAVLGDVLERIDALNATMEDLLTYARPRKPKLAEVDLDLLMAALLHRAAADPLLQGVDLDVDGGGLRLRADAPMLEGALLNLLINAAQAMQGAGSIAITARHEPAAGGRPEAIAIAVRDDGPGMDPGIAQRVFEPFFTTRHRGTGLGLAIVQRVAAAHDGDVGLQTAKGHGTTVTLRLPVFGPGA